MDEVRREADDEPEDELMINPSVRSNLLLHISVGLVQSLADARFFAFHKKKLTEARFR
jgi:hypothetical protein